MSRLAPSGARIIIGIQARDNTMQYNTVIYT
jgi:hypothetical protein